ncbi:Asp-tRNA(Asn)/Glu-tRNA(Gln) amidotransferase subunit GatA [Salisediminibacterium halotolerans]|uniref:Asp-tRNA(Asn)/Glu-tRNA(Gln) amidotransferase subunit GatA n=1 Tax=Salisediminibacterium halotolerans TaxID=517425 RepID=UPI000EAB5583|nr:Asp-tRNA(Asn)/Glu-tRNA(Gln) amidotransferase subunit GatA [Salisediminibacterium halotolerans]RLJ71780.1 aspartyl/glutamyl-tRNA(Asn/Gln) amidotransferase subunit A [Actinophytocola xinjiangensis]RPE86930.1 aspartyl/glutamyl-tRNA(Asn/Gln) amidotransferase subunit A [Salisediminibacterium halotolerans]TWG32993.1 aspartyl/glutamyl-tRNA(Asn/Gln) amidotransferase subunit A [Salisediminibacterium halotolerans]GEL08536.1 glutamyl-tRNA(Gln) amidotransferase subunit A [Salisediminibacterium halotoler
MIDQSIKTMKEKLASGDITVRQLVDASIERIEEVDGTVGAFLRLDKEGARLEADRLDMQLMDGKMTASAVLAGIPVGIKDNIVTKDITTTCASAILSNFDPIHNATVVNRLHEAGTVTIGKLNMDEFAMGSSNENSSFHVVKNPWNLAKVPGGSSGGSAAAVAAGEVPFTLGSDTGGSIRQPASYCGVTGLKPTYGRVSRFGLVAYASSLDQIGPITRSAEDSAYVMQAIAGHDAADSTSANVDVPDYTEKLYADVSGLKAAVPAEYLGDGIDEGVKSRVKEAIAVLEEQGIAWEEVSLPYSKYALPTYYILASSEASANLARFDGIRYGVRHESDNLIDTYKKSRSEGFGEEVKRRIMLGTFALSTGYYDAYYKKAQKVRTLIKQDFDKIFERFDLIIGPTAPTTAFGLGEELDDPLTMYANDILTIPVNLAGVPAISVPCGFSDSLPVGLQIIGKHFDEATVLQVANAYQQQTDFHTAKPDL